MVVSQETTIYIGRVKDPERRENGLLSWRSPLSLSVIIHLF